MVEDPVETVEEHFPKNNAGGTSEDSSRLSRADVLKVAGATAAGLVLGSDTTHVLARAASKGDTRVVRCAIYPGIGVARVGNSPHDFFIGPEAPGLPANAARPHKDAAGRVKRQAARFRLYGLNAAGEVVREITAHDANITWTVHLANKKASWYQFEFPLDLPDAFSLPADQASRRRNATHRGTARRELIIDPGARSIRGVNVEGRAHHFDTGELLGRNIPLGELRTDSAGHLLVLGGFGLAASFDGSPLRHVTNNDGWYDDIADGPVTAQVIMDGRGIPVESAWVVVAPPSYAPDIAPIVTLYDIAYQAYLDGHPRAHRAVSFTRDIYPIFERFSRWQWVNEGFFKLYGWMAPDDFLDPAYLAQLASNDRSHAAFRHLVFGRFRSPSDGNRVDAWPRVYGDSIFEAVTAPTHLFLSVTREQYRCLEAWAQGDFAADWKPGLSKPQRFEELPLQSRPSALNRAALDACSGGPFHPGEETPWIMRNASLYTDLCRLRVRSPHDPPEPDYGDVLSPQAAMGPRGPLHRSGPGDITRWMAVPWQTDTANCGAGYPGTTASQPAGDLPTFWPALVPNHVLTERLYEQVLQYGHTLSKRRSAFQTRPAWARHLPSEGIDPGENAHRNAAFTRSWHRFGFVVQRPGPGDAAFPRVMYVETESGFPDVADET